MNTIAVVATHHKAGTVWMNHTFRTIAEKLGIRFWPAMAFTSIPEAERTPPLILNTQHGGKGVEPGLFDREDIRIFHLIRDPRDILISSMHYHMRAKEKWLLRPDEKFDGRTYQDALNALTSERARYVFEMRESTSKNIDDLTNWNYARANTIECRYEDLIRDTERKLFAKIVRHLGFAQDEVPICRRIFWKQAIFGGNAKAKEPGGSAHVRSGEPEQWRNVFDRKLGEAFLAQFGSALLKLGYEKDGAWLESLPTHRPELDV